MALGLPDMDDNHSVFPTAKNKRCYVRDRKILWQVGDIKIEGLILKAMPSADVLGSSSEETLTTMRSSASMGTGWVCPRWEWRISGQLVLFPGPAGIFHNRPGKTAMWISRLQVVQDTRSIYLTDREEDNQFHNRIIVENSGHCANHLIQQSSSRLSTENCEIIVLPKAIQPMALLVLAHAFLMRSSW